MMICFGESEEGNCDEENENGDCRRSEFERVRIRRLWIAVVEIHGGGFRETFVLRLSKNTENKRKGF